MKNLKDGTSWTVPQSHLSYRLSWISQSWFYPLLNFGSNQCLALKPALSPSTDCIFMGCNIIFVDFVRYFWSKQEKKNFFLIFCLVWILFWFSRAGDPGESIHSDMNNTVNWLALAPLPFLMDIFWALMGYDQKLQKAVCESLCGVLGTSWVSSLSKSRSTESRKYSPVFLRVLDSPSEHYGGAGE